jgi:hypothetical protein
VREGHRPICQDTGIVCAFVKVGMDVRWDGVTMSPTDMINEGVRRAYNDPDNRLRASIVGDPLGKRQEHERQHAAVVHYELVPGNTIDIKIAAKGGGSENKSKFTMLNPSDSVVEWVLKTVPTMGAGWCPPGMLGLGIGGTAEKAMVLAKDSLMAPIDMHELRRRGPATARGAAPRALREGQRARHRRAGARRTVDRARREDPRLPDARGFASGRDDPELRRDAPSRISRSTARASPGSIRPTCRYGRRALDAVARPLSA